MYSLIIEYIELCQSHTSTFIMLDIQISKYKAIVWYE